MRRYIFPYKEIKSGSRIIIYGVGEVGRQYISQIESSVVMPERYMVEVLFAVDQYGYYTFAKLHGIKVYEPRMITLIDPDTYDYVLVASEKQDTVQEIKNNLQSFGVPESKVIHAIHEFDDISYLYSPEIKKWFKPTFSYFGEDLIVKGLFWRIGIETPDYLDIGCNHPYEGSNTALLYLTGSKGVNIDANYKCIELMEKERPDDQNICCGVMTEEGEKDFIMVSDLSPLNSFSESYIDFYIKTYISTEEIEHKVSKVSCYTLGSIIDKYCGGIFPDYLDLDIEGMDEAVMASYDFSKNGPKIICVETHADKVNRQMSAQGYEIFFSTPHNTIYVQREYMGDNVMFLKRIDDCVEEIRFELKSRLSAFVEKEYKLVIYGVGMVGRRVFECLSCGEERIPVEGFMVEWPDRNPSYWMGKKVKGIGEYDPDRCIVLVALATHNRPGVVEKLSSMGYQNVVMLDKNSNLL